MNNLEKTSDDFRCLFLRTNFLLQPFSGKFPRVKNNPSKWSEKENAKRLRSIFLSFSVVIFNFFSF